MMKCPNCEKETDEMCMCHHCGEIFPGTEEELAPCDFDTEVLLLRRIRKLEGKDQE